MTDPLLIDTADGIMAAACTAEALRGAEHTGFAPGAWAAVAEAGLPWISVPAEAGGEGGDLADALAVLRIAGRHGLPLPLAETGVLGGWLLAASGLPVDRVPATVASGTGLAWSDGTVHGTARLVPWGRAAAQVVVLIGDEDGATGVVAVFDAADLRIESHVNVAGEPRDTVCFAGTSPLASAPAGPGVTAAALRRRGALTRVVLMAGAVRAILDLTVRYTSERHQFGRPIARFPGVQQHVVHLAQQSAMLEMAADLLGGTAAADPSLAGPAAAFQVAAAKTVAHDAAMIATAAAHQAHGAMGVTQEYPLHHLTRRMWAWTREYGTGARSADEVGALVAEGGADALWPMISSGGATALG
ncbi:acyl-CoA dehydrogenase family protein [Actinomadura sp. SCN-SB]|uniref:acyl-CoA dehydrogenase family protein n=1 Tax=Actinomadura sp. SCN-SB TaxID=3373092 RepID=UPI0037501BE5